MRNPQLPGAALGFSPLGLDPAFPLDIVLDGQRDDQAITQLHIHDALEIGCCLEGSGTFYIGSKILPFHQGDVTVITDREFHRCRSSPGTRSRWAWFFLHPPRLLVPHATPALAWEPERFCGPKFTNVIAAAAHPAIAALASQLIAEARQTDAHVRTNLRALLVLLLNELHRRFPKPRRKAKADHSARALTRIAPALQMTASHFHKPLTIPELAQCCAMSVRNFQLQFTRLMGLSPQAHLLNSRIQAAAALLADKERSIADIAYACGFNTLSSFNRAFKAMHEKSPREYRTRRRP
ncbi:MAG: AraC family transcriptional regulator [Chthoniobacteraceae bacterium]